MRRFLTAILLTTLLTYATQVHAETDLKVPHPSGGRVDFLKGKSGPLRYTFDLHITGRELSEFVVIAPTGVKLSSAVNVTSIDGKSINAGISMEANTLKITFAKPVTIGTKLRIELDQVKTINNLMIWNLETAGKVDGISQPISLMTLRIQPGIRR